MTGPPAKSPAAPGTVYEAAGGRKTMKSKTFTGRVYALALLLGAGILVWAVIVHHLGAPRLPYGPCPKGSTLTYNWIPASSPIGNATDMPAGYPQSGIEEWFGSREIASCAGVLTVGLHTVPAGPLGRLEAFIPAGDRHYVPFAAATAAALLVLHVRRRIRRFRRPRRLGARW
jgi:hypothetical protein